MISAIFCLFFTQACAPISHNYALNVPKSVMPYVLQFELQAILHGRNIRINDLTVEFADIASRNVVGLCYTGTDYSSPRIQLDTNYWKYADKWQRELLLFHELGHCILDLDHNNAINAEGMPESIMNYGMFNAYYYESNREDYLKQLFGADTIGLYKETL